MVNNNSSNSRDKTLSGVLVDSGIRLGMPIDNGSNSSLRNKEGRGITEITRAMSITIMRIKVLTITSKI